MTQAIPHAERMAAAEREARRMRQAMAAWREAHPHAGPGEVQLELRRRRRELMARLLRILGGPHAEE